MPDDTGPAISLHAVATATFEPMLEMLAAVVDKAAAHAEASGLDLMEARLAPDMYPFSKQIGIACRHAKDVMGRLSGLPGLPLMSETATSIDGMKAQVSEALQVVRSSGASGFAAADPADCTIHVSDAMRIELDARHFLLSWALPNFYFHAVTAYDIARHHGVPLSKQDFLTGIRPFVRQK